MKKHRNLGHHILQGSISIEFGNLTQLQEL